ncbi:MAG: hypothetical protein ACK56I_34510 [bacterium]
MKCGNLGVFSGEFRENLALLLKSSLGWAEIAYSAADNVPHISFQNGCDPLFPCDWIKSRMNLVSTAGQPRCAV